MANFQKYLIPLLVIAVVVLMYVFYFAPTKELGDFNDYDPNAHVQKEINVLLMVNEGFDYKSTPGKVVFYVKDKKGKKVAVVAPAELPEGIENEKVIELFGHLHGNTFEAVEVRRL